MKRLILLLLAAVAACSSGPSSVGARFAGPTALVEYWGVTRNNPGPAVDASGLRQYLAVADARGSDLRLLDPSVDQPVLGPGVVYPLSLPTLPRPRRVAAASLGDHATGGADALVSASAGEPTLQVVDTWTTENRIAFNVDLAGILGADAGILAMTGLTATATDATGTHPVGRIVVAASGGQVVLVDFARGSGGAVVLARTPVAQDVQHVGFDAVDLALDPDGKTVYAATGDALGTHADGTPLYGVASFDTSGDPTLPLTVKVLDARAPTVTVAAARVDERVVGAGSCSAEQFVGAQVLRVYAALDPARCGPDFPIACGLVTLDPATGQLVAQDPAAAAVPPDAAPGSVAVPPQGFRAPMPIPGVPLHIAIAGAPVLNPNSTAINLSSDSVPSTACPTRSATPLARVLNGGTLRFTSALAMVTSSDGHVYWLDLSRFGPVNDTTTVNGALRTAVLRAASDPVGAGAWQLGLWFDTAGSTATGTVVLDALTLPAAIEVWPGFTPAGEWNAVYQGPLPGMAARAGAVAVANDGTAWAALQSDSGQTSFGVGDAARWSVAVRVDDPGRGVHVGDVVTFPDLGCEAAVAEIVPGPAVEAGVAFPGGALRLAAPLPACLAGVASPLLAQITILSGDVVVSNDANGYLGRATISISADRTDEAYALVWQDEDKLAASSAPAARETLAVARRARRIFYPTDGPCPVAGATSGQATQSAGCYTGFPRLADPLSPGPAARFRLGLRNPTVPAAVPTAADRPPRGTGVHFATQTGLVQTSRRPTLGGAPPASLVAVDPGLFAGHENEDVRYYVTYQDDQVISFVPTDVPSQVHTIR